MVQTGYHGKFLYRKGGQNTGRGFLERWLLSSDCQHSRDVWITPLIVYCNIWLALKWSSTWTRCLKAPCNGTILFLFLFCKGSTKQIHPLCLNFLLCVLNSSGCTILVLSPNSARHLIMSNLTGFGKIDVLELMMKVLCWDWRVEEQMFSYPQCFLGLEHLIMKVFSLPQPCNGFYRHCFSKLLIS